MTAAIALSACADLARVISPAGDVDARPARVALTASVASASVRADDAVSLQVLTSYVLADGRKVAIGTQTLQLSSATTQAVPIPVDIAGCLADGARDGGAASSGCAVVLALALSVNGAVVDRQTVGPLRLAPGATATVAEPVALFEIADLELAPGGALALTVGGSATLTPTVRDSRGAPVLGRTVVFSSDAPTIASVDGTGRVTALAPGSARITATLGEISKTVTASVARAPQALTVSATAGSGTGVVRSSPAGIDCRFVAGVTSGVCVFSFAADANVTLTSTSDAGHVFTSWGGACVGNAVGANCSLAMSQTQNVSARFSAIRVLTVRSVGTDGSGRVTGPAGLNCRISGSTTSGTCVVSVPDGTPVQLSGEADAADGTRGPQVFDGWGDACVSALGTTCTLTPNGANMSVSAGFFDARLLTLQLSGPGGGSLRVENAVCTRAAGSNSGDCAPRFAHGAQVTVTAQADGQSSFGSWGGACAGQGTNCVLSMSQARLASATFERPQAVLTLVLAGDGNGSILVNGVPVCSRTLGSTTPVTCTREYPVGTSLTISNAVGGQTEFAGYGDDCSGLAPCAVVMNDSRRVTATFATIQQLSLTIDPTGVGSGSVISGEATPRINCTIDRGQPTAGSVCTTTVAAGTDMVLRATGLPNFAHTGWAGRCAGGTTYECAITVTAPARVSASFGPAIDLEARAVGAGQGRITFAPVGAPSQAPCVMTELGVPATCRFSLPSGTIGFFSGVANGGSTYQGIVGPCSESASGEAVPVCTYRGVGFLRTFIATFTRP
ncbi:MAG: Ig domain-containing protein [Gemmatimonadaceae bacterium]|nr:Ig domain-containing protein [Gemmatimonadaceae bacterium]